MKSYSPILVVLAILMGCASPQNHPPTTAQAERKDWKFSPGESVALIVQIGDTLHFRKWGTTVFGNNSWDGDISEWGIPEKLKDQAEAIFGSYGIGVAEN